MKKKIIAVALITAIFLLSVGCSKDESIESSSAEKSKVTMLNEEPIKIGVYLWPSWYIWYVSEAENMFEEHGLNVELVSFPVYSDMLSAFNSGNIDVIGLTACDAIFPYNEDIGLKIVLVNDISNGADAIVVNNKFDSLKDVKGLDVGVEIGTLEHLLLLTALQSNEMTRDDINIINISMADAAPAMVGESLMAAAMADPYGSQVVASGKGKKIITSADYPGLITDCTAFSEDLIENNRVAAVELLKVWFETLDYVNDNMENAISIMSDQADISDEEYVELWNGVKIYSYEENVESFKIEKEDYSYLPYSVEVEAQFLYDQDLIENVKSSYDDLFDVSLIEEAIN